MIPEIDATYSLKTRPIRENKIEVMSENGGGLDANADLTNFFVQMAETGMLHIDNTKIQLVT